MTAPTSPPTTEPARDAWDALAPRYDQFTTPENMTLAEQALAHVEVAAGTRFLDVACGSGAVSLPAARHGAHVTAVDFSPTMIERLLARARTEGLGNVEGMVMDATALDLPDDTFDVSASQNGVSLLADLQRGLREMVRVTRRGGRVMVVAFGAPQNAEFITFPMTALKAVVPDFTPLAMDPPPPPFQLADRDTFGQELADAGLADVAVATASWDMRFTSGSHLWNMLTSSNPVAVQLTGGLTAEQREEAQHVLGGMLRERSGGAPHAVLHNEMNIGIGTR